MRKLPVLLITFVMCGCNMNPHIKDYGIVEQVELCEHRKVSTDYTTKYCVRVSADFNANWIHPVYVYTNELYSVGDTIQITVKH